jgi:hypothetical protein
MDKAAVQVDPSQAEASPSLLLKHSGRLETHHTLSNHSHFPSSLPANSYTGAAAMASNHHYQDDYYNNWDSRSAKSYNTQHSNYSTQYLNPQYTHAPPVPQLPYSQPVVDYPPMQPPQPQYGGPYNRAASIASGYSSARDKLMKRRVSADYIRLLLRSGETPSPPLGPSWALLRNIGC